VRSRPAENATGPMKKIPHRGCVMVWPSPSVPCGLGFLVSNSQCSRLVILIILGHRSLNPDLTDETMTVTSEVNTLTRGFGQVMSCQLQRLHHLTIGDSSQLSHISVTD
jgi:hypothetical protein